MNTNPLTIAFLRSLGFQRGTWGWWVDLPTKGKAWLTCACGLRGSDENVASCEWWINSGEDVPPDRATIADSIPTEERLLALLEGLGVSVAMSTEQPIGARNLE